MKNQPQPDLIKGRIPQLDGLRAIAIILVLMYHSFETAPIPWLRHLTGIGWVGVDLFFVLSGFLIGGIVLDQREAANYYRVFYWRRFLRIVPLYAAILLPGLLIVGTGMRHLFAGHSIGDQPVGGIWFCLLFLQNCSGLLGFDVPHYLGPTWSLAVEEQFYLLLPPLVRKLNFSTLMKVLVAAIIAAPLIRGAVLWFYGEKGGGVYYSFLPCRWDSLLLGVVSAGLVRQNNFRQRLVDRLQILRILWLALAAVAVAIMSQCSGWLCPLMAFTGYTVVDACFACTLLLAILNPNGWLHGFLGWPAFKPVATISYGLYLLPGPVAGLVAAVFHRAGIPYDETSWVAILTCLVVSIVAASLSWRFYESRLIRLGHKSHFQRTTG